MPKFRTRPTEVIAEQFDGTLACAKRLGLNHVALAGGRLMASLGAEPVGTGDWVIRTGPETEWIGVCRKEVFQRAYDPVPTNEEFRARVAEAHEAMKKVSEYWKSHRTELAREGTRSYEVIICNYPKFKPCPYCIKEPKP